MASETLEGGGAPPRHGSPQSKRQRVGYGTPTQFPQTPRRRPLDPSELAALWQEEASLHEGRDYLSLCLICNTQTDHGILHCPYMVFAVQHDVFKKPLARLRFGSYSKNGKVVGCSKKRSLGYEKTAEENEAAALRLEEEGVNLVRITNIPENSREPEQLFDVFGGVGCVTHVTVFHEEGFGFVNFASKEDAIQAIKEISGYGQLMCATQRPQ